MAAATLPGTPANFWRRSAAWLLDWLLLSPLLWLTMRPAWLAASAEYLAMRARLEDWISAQDFAGDSTTGLWLDLNTKMLADPALHASIEQSTLRLTALLTEASLVAALLASVYFIAFEASRWQATPGKRLLGLRVIAIDGRDVDAKRAALRFFAGSLSWLSLNLGHALALFRKDGRALHDLIAGTGVIRP
jgi:uncharacterized RDD family membrane protein YckC